MIGSIDPPRLYLLDWAVIAAYALGMLAIGYLFAKRTKSTDEYLTGGRNMRSSSIGLSLFATLMSTITYLAIPGEMINKGPVILWWMAVLPVVYLIVGYALIPLFMKLAVTSAYEILETRLGLTGRLTASVIFLATRLLWMALIIYLTADKLIVKMLGWNDSATPWVAAAIGIITVIYTSMGGLRAVVLTDVIQSLILLGGAILTVVVITVNMGGVGAWWPREWSPSWDQQPFFSWDPTVRVTVLGSLVFMTIWWICTAGSDQMAIQRYLATRDARAARKAFGMTLIANVVVHALLVCVGFALLGFFRAHPENLMPGMTIEKNADNLFPYYIVRFLPPGITGLVIAGLLAAAMSSLSSGINSACSVISSDFIGRFKQRRGPLAGLDADDKSSDWSKAAAKSSDPDALAATQPITVGQTRLIAVISGLAAVLLSFVIGGITGNIMEITVRTNHIFAAPLFALFFMALFVRSATGFGTIFGALYGCGVAMVIAYWDMLTGRPPLSFQWISLISLVVSIGAGILLSRVIPRSKTWTGWAIQSLVAALPLVALFVVVLQYRVG
ncbi:MAG TPA: sodium-coupled permease [Phycisphaerae bacterium]|nr:sodium-coupled permease [Phycisphaerae bacterium]